MKLLKNGQVVRTATQTQNIYILNTIREKQSEMAFGVFQETARIWHERLGHINIDYLEDMINNNTVNGFNIEKSKSSDVKLAIW